MTHQIPFLVETERVLEILSKQIYDSPFAMARENIQNAYDAILMRSNKEGTLPEHYKIEVTASEREIKILDQGIGMSEKVLRENFWKAGSSGKNNEAARAAGVIGTFGIGAMANFGVCDRLQVDSRALEEPAGTRTVALKDQLAIGKDCITVELLDESFEVGTLITASISSKNTVDVEAMRQYLTPFVRFLPAPVTFNGELISQNNPRSAAGIGSNWACIGSKSLATGRFSFDAHVYADAGQIGVQIDKLFIDNEGSSGGLWLRSGGGSIMGLRSKFGLAPIPLPSHYGFNGFADLPFLFPTAGREALTRESIQQASVLMGPIEMAVTEILKDTPFADQLSAFQQHILVLGKIEWASRVEIQLNPGDQRVELGRISSAYPGVQLSWFDGTDPDVISTFSSEEAPLLRVSQQNPRRDLQRRYLTDVLRLRPIPNTATVTETYAPADLTWDEVTLTLSLARILKADYLIDDVAIEWVKISHNVPMLAELAGDRLTIKVSRTWMALQAVLKIISATPEVAEGMAKDFVRVHVYERIKNFVPSSQRAGLDTLQKTLARRRELYRLEAEDKGDLEPLIAEYLAGHVELSELLTAATTVATGHTQRVSSDTVATVEQVLSDVVNTSVQAPPVQSILVPIAGSPILRPEADLKERLLTTEKDVAQLNNHRMFLALSDRLFQLEREFFSFPHSTQVAWAGKRIVFLFGLANSSQNLYYDIELRGAQTVGAAGGMPVITTTIVTKNRIFVPIPEPLTEYFKVTQNPVEFYVRFDLLGN